MWIKILASYDYNGPGGPLQLINGETRELDRAIVKNLPKTIYQPAVAPWDQHKDQLTSDIDIAQQKFLTLQSESNLAHDARRTAGESVKKLNKLVPALKKKLTQVKKGGKKLAELNLAKAEGELKAATADLELKTIAADKAKKAADKSAGNLQKLKDQKALRDAPAEPESEEKPDESQTEVETQTEDTTDQPTENADNPSGQTDNDQPDQVTEDPPVK